ncbi:hypothetical protein D3C80_1401740 [compost metagenome]
MVGPACGRVIDQNTRKGLAPTSRAASSMRRSTAWKAATGIQIMNISVPTNWISTTPQKVPMRLSCRKIAAIATSRPNFGKAWPARKEKNRISRPGNFIRAKA